MYSQLVRTAVFAGLVLAYPTGAFTQEIPNDAVHLPQKIGGSKSGLNKVDSVSVSGKITFIGIPQDERNPVAYAAVFKFGRLVGRRQASENGSFTLDDVPREGSTIVVEIDNIEVASSQIVPSPADVYYRDFSVTWNQIPRKTRAPGVVSVKNTYVRSKDNQERFETALDKLNANKPEAAITLLRSVLSSDPNDFGGLTELGIAYLLTGKTSDAVKSFEAALAVNPGYVGAKLGLGRALVSQQNFENAIKVLSAVVSAEPSLADGQHFLGEAYLLTKKGSKAVPHLNEALRLAPVRKAEIHLLLAALYNGAGYKDRAALEYKEFLFKIPKHERRKELQRYVDENLKTK